MYGSDFFYSNSNGDQHQYDNLIVNNKAKGKEKENCQHYEPFPIVVDDVRFVSPSTSSQDRSCQVPSDDELDQQQIDNEPKFDQEKRTSKRSSPVYNSPRSSPTFCRPPRARNLLSAYHFRRQQSLSSSVALYARSKSAPSASSSSVSTRSTRNPYTIDENSGRLPVLLCPLENSSVEPEATSTNSTKSTAALLRSIKSSIHAMRKRLKEIRRFSEVGH